MERIREYCHAYCETALTPLARLLLRLHVSANQVTVAGVLLNVVAAVLIVADQPVLAGLFFLAGGVLDLLDGVLARLAKMATPFGAFLDSTLDRVSEGVLFAAIAYRFALEGAAFDAGLTVLALLGSLLVSYTRARAEGLSVQCKGGLVTRAERVILLAAGLLSGLLAYVIYLLVVTTGFTVIQRIVSTFRRIAAPGGAGKMRNGHAVGPSGTENSSSD
ncbi:MAG: CDP-alcohol phosphatidyltransferase family protein [Alphaproteobacteria bacterium]|jgi:CDP-diacylglycerol--glycerol-3-phosphate 3-phosphatidyltransferase|nr:CDP-alcohol phosphatidyltransferase family protein [Rhodospirillales bacterium]MDP6951519.1 CDP-alcohol phosphatidyltransferase family protein [Alphaproteobacteria bacterium]